MGWMVASFGSQESSSKSSWTVECRWAGGWRALARKILELGTMGWRVASFGSKESGPWVWEFRALARDLNCEL